MSEINGPNFSLNQVNFNSSQKQPIDSLQGVKEEAQVRSLLRTSTLMSA